MFCCRNHPQIKKQMQLQWLFLVQVQYKWNQPAWQSYCASSVTFLCTLFCFHLSICFLVLYPVPLLFGLCSCGHQGNSSNLPTHVPVGQGAIRGQSTSLSSCHKWCWWDGEGSRLCFEGQQGRSPALCLWLSGSPDQHRKIHLWNEVPIQPHTDITIVTRPGFECTSWM